MKITATLLREHRACSNQLALFERAFPDGMDVDEETLLRATEVGLDLDWAAREFLPSPLRAEYDPLLAEYDRQRAPLLANYNRQRDLLWADYERQRDPLLAEYKRQHDPLWAEYKRQHDPLWDEYKRKRKPLWADYERQRARVLAKIVKDLP